MAGHVTLAEVRSGQVCLLDLMKINAILDSQDAAQQKASHGNRQ